MQAKGKPGRKFLTPLPYRGIVSCVLSHVHDQIVVCVLTRFAFFRNILCWLFDVNLIHIYSLSHVQLTMVDIVFHKDNRAATEGTKCRIHFCKLERTTKKTFPRRTFCMTFFPQHNKMFSHFFACKIMTSMFWPLFLFLNR